MFLTFVTILPLTIPANSRLSSQFLSVGLKVGVRVWYKVNVRFGIINNTKNVRFGFSLSWFKGPCCVSNMKNSSLCNFILREIAYNFISKNSVDTSENFPFCLDIVV
jgi:hypothetical protein